MLQLFHFLFAYFKVTIPVFVIGKNNLSSKLGEGFMQHENHAILFPLGVFFVLFFQNAHMKCNMLNLITNE